MENEEIDETIISEFAEDDLDEIAAYYFSRSPDYVERIISAFEEGYGYKKLIKIGMLYNKDFGRNDS